MLPNSEGKGDFAPPRALHRFRRPCSGGEIKKQFIPAVKATFKNGRRLERGQHHRSSLYYFTRTIIRDCQSIFLASWACTGKWMWDKSIFSIIKPSFDIILFQDLWRFAEIWAQNCFYCFWTILGTQLAKLFRNDNKQPRKGFRPISATKIFLGNL